MDAKNDTEVVKQSMSSALSVFIGMGIIGVTAVVLFKAIEANIPNNIIMATLLVIFGAIYLSIDVVLHKICDKSFDNISV